MELGAQWPEIPAPPGRGERLPSTPAGARAFVPVALLVGARLAGGGGRRDRARLPGHDLRLGVARHPWVSDLVSSFGVKPSAVIGYSLGETAGLFAMRAWTAARRDAPRHETSRAFSSATWPAPATRPGSSGTCPRTRRWIGCWASSTGPPTPSARRSRAWSAPRS